MNIKDLGDPKNMKKYSEPINEDADENE